MDGTPPLRAEPQTQEAGDQAMEKIRDRLAARLRDAPKVEPEKPGVLRISTRSTVEPKVTPPASRRVAAASVGAGATGKPAAKGAAVHDGHAPHWSYEGEQGPQAWASLSGEFGRCSSGSRQSPIDIRDGIPLQLDPVRFDYRPVPFKVIDNGNTIQVNVSPGNSIEVMGRRYDLVQFHFHKPSEERVNGRQFDMGVHLVHKDLDGRLAVVAVLLERGGFQPVVQTVWNHLPLEKHEEVAVSAPLDLNRLLPAERGYFTYMGSITTPPCSEGVLWMVMKEPVPVSSDQISVFSRFYPMNARPIQSTAGRLIKESF